MNLAKEFDWFSFNLSLSKKVLSRTRKAIVIDPSYISKSGKQTPWIGYFWSDYSGAAKRELEINCLKSQNILLQTLIFLRRTLLMGWPNSDSI